MIQKYKSNNIYLQYYNKIFNLKNNKAIKSHGYRGLRLDDLPAELILTIADFLPFFDDFNFLSINRFTSSLRYQCKTPNHTIKTLIIHAKTCDKISCNVKWYINKKYSIVSKKQTKKIVLYLSIFIIFEIIYIFPLCIILSESIDIQNKKLKRVFEVILSMIACYMLFCILQNSLYTSLYIGCGILCFVIFINIPYIPVALFYDVVYSEIFCCEINSIKDKMSKF